MYCFKQLTIDLLILSCSNDHKFSVVRPLFMVYTFFFIILLCSPCSMCMPGISISNKKGPNSFSAVFRKLNFR